jgi:hypothetical protein
MVGSVAIAESPSQDDVLDFVEGRLDPAREASLRRALAAVPGALERAEAMRRDRDATLHAIGSAPERVPAPASAAHRALDAAGVGVARRSRVHRWKPAMVGAGALLAACIAWVAIVEMGLLTPSSDRDLSRLIIDPSKSPPPTKKGEVATPGVVDQFLAESGVEGRLGSAPHAAGADDQPTPLPERLWPGRDAWGLVREVDAHEAGEWLNDRRLAVILRMPDGESTKHQLRLLSSLDGVSLGPDNEVITVPREANGSAQVNAAQRGPVASGSEVRVLWGLVETGEGTLAAPTLDEVTRALYDWLTTLPVIEGGSIQLIELGEDSRLPAPQEEVIGTVFARQRLLIIQIEPPRAPESGTSGDGNDDRPWIDGRAPGTSPTGLQPASW